MFQWKMDKKLKSATYSKKRRRKSGRFCPDKPITAGGVPVSTNQSERLLDANVLATEVQCQVVLFQSRPGAKLTANMWAAVG